MRKIIAIGINTFREAIRNKVLYSLVFFAVVVIISSLAFGALSVHEEARLTTDLGLGGMSSFLVLIAIFVGVNLVYKELERKTVYTLIPKPIHRYQFVLGKFTGLVATLVVLLLMMSSVLLLVLFLQGAPLRPQLSMMVVLIFLEVLVVTAIAVLFSSFSTPFLSGLFTVGVFLLGRSVPDIRLVAEKLEQPVLPELLRVVARIVPNLRFFYVTGTELHGEQISVHGTFIDWGYVGLAGGYAAFYLAALLLIAIALFSRRDFV
jgi:ABC-type transport system involved in multi-copper enzyme maturation permease subunit